MTILDKILNSLPQVSDKNRKFILGGILFLIFVVYYFVIMQPQLSTLRALNPEIMVITQDLQRAKDDIARMATYKKQVAELQNKVNQLGGGIKSREEVPRILERISLLANKYRMRIDQIMPLAENQELLLKNNDGKYFALPILIECRSGYHDLGRFLNEMGQNDVSLTIDKFTITANSQNLLKHSIKLTINAIILEAVGEK